MFRVPSGVDLANTQRYFRTTWNRRTEPTQPSRGTGAHFGFLCYTNRSGSNLLAHLLKAAGLYGPQSFREYFNPDRMRSAKSAHDLGSLQGYCQFLKGGDGTRFGTKINPRQLVFLAQTGLLTAEYAQSHFIYIERHDRLDQAISLVKAERTQEWAKTGPGESAAADRVRYDEKAIAQAIHRLAESANTFETFFALNGIRPARIVYEDLAADPAKSLQSLLDQLDLARPYQFAEAISKACTRMQKQADEINERWRAAFLQARDSN